MRYMVANLDKPLTIPAIATEFYISRNKLSHDFKQFTRTTLHQFIVNLRVNRAKELLRSPAPPNIREVAQQCGFENEYYFYEFFKTQTGMTPHGYQKSQKRQKSEKKPQ